MKQMSTANIEIAKELNKTAKKLETKSAQLVKREEALRDSMEGGKKKAAKKTTKKAVKKTGAKKTTKKATKKAAKK